MFNFNIMQTVQSSKYNSEFTKNCSHLFFFARQSLFFFYSFCESSSNFRFLSVPTWSLLRLVVLAVYFSGCFSLQLLAWYLLVPNQIICNRYIRLALHSFVINFSYLLLSYYSSLILLVHLFSLLPLCILCL